MGKLLLWKKKAVNYLSSWIPSYIESVVHVSMKESGVQKVYDGPQHWYHWAHARMQNMFLTDEGFYVIHLWNPLHSHTDHYFLDARILSKALGLRNLGAWWALTEFGTMLMLSVFMFSQKVDKQRYVGLLIDAKDISSLVSPFTSSLCLDNNVTAAALCRYVAYLQGLDPKKCDTNEVTVVTYDLEEVTVRGDEYLFKSSAK
jgi:hypothetical protein